MDGVLKCNIYSNWRNAYWGAWITRDNTGNVRHHARDAFTCSLTKFMAELRCLEWVLQSLKDLQYQEIIIGTKPQELIEPVKKPSSWHRFRIILQRISVLCSEFQMVAFEAETGASNQVAHAIAKSVLRDGRLQSYHALAGPGWLHNRIRLEIPVNDSLVFPLRLSHCWLLVCLLFWFCFQNPETIALALCLFYIEKKQIFKIIKKYFVYDLT